MKTVVGISSKPSQNSSFKKIYLRYFYQWISLPYYVMELQTPAWLNKKLYMFFFDDPDTIEPTLTFFEGLGLESNQDVNGILDAIKIVFENFSLSSLLDKVVFLSSDGAYVNSGKKSGWKKVNIAPYFKESLIN